MCQFLYVPQEWQIPFLCAGGFVWSVILSSLALQAPPQVGAADAPMQCDDEASDSSKKDSLTLPPHSLKTVLRQKRLKSQSEVE